MNDAQTIFTIFYGLYFAVTLTLTGILQPFDTPSMYKKNTIAWLRFLISFVLLNFLPLIYFVFIFGFLSGLQNFSVTIPSMTGLLLLSLVGFGFYRIYWGVMLIPNNDGYFFYGKELPFSLKDQLDKREESHRDYKAHLIPGIIWILFLGGIGYLLLKT